MRKKKSNQSANKINFSFISKKQNNIKIVAELLDDDEVTNKDVIFIQNFIKLFKSRKDKNLYR